MITVVINYNGTYKSGRHRMKYNDSGKKNEKVNETKREKKRSMKDKLDGLRRRSTGKVSFWTMLSVQWRH